MNDESTLREKAREVIQAVKFPNRDPDRIWGGPGVGADCTICKAPVTGVEELYLLHGELMIDDKELYPGDDNRAEAGSADQRVWSETGCTCVLLTSTQDVLR